MTFPHYSGIQTSIKNFKIHVLPWRNWLARSTVNRKVGGSSPPGSELFYRKSRFRKCDKNPPRYGVDHVRCLGDSIMDSLFVVSAHITLKTPLPGGLEPPTFRLTVERANQLRHGSIGRFWPSFLIRDSSSSRAQHFVRRPAREFFFHRQPF